MVDSAVYVGLRRARAAILHCWPTAITWFIAVWAVMTLQKI